VCVVNAVWGWWPTTVGWEGVSMGRVGWGRVGWAGARWGVGTGVGGGPGPGEAPSRPAQTQMCAHTCQKWWQVCLQWVNVCMPANPAWGNGGRAVKLCTVVVCENGTTGGPGIPASCPPPEFVPPGSSRERREGIGWEKHTPTMTVRVGMTSGARTRNRVIATGRE